jgi:hypothetical protein
MQMAQDPVMEVDLIGTMYCGVVPRKHFSVLVIQVGVAGGSGA